MLELLTNLGLFSKLMFGEEFTRVLQNPWYFTLEGIDSKFYFENKLQYTKLQDELFIIVSFVTLQQVYNNEVFQSCAQIPPTLI